METELTQEEIQRNILAAYDSVNLINELELIQDPNTETLDIISRNKEHLKIMLAKEWFSEALTEQQTTEITQVSEN